MLWCMRYATMISDNPTATSAAAMAMENSASVCPPLSGMKPGKRHKVEVGRINYDLHCKEHTDEVALYGKAVYSDAQKGHRHQCKVN